MHVVFEDVKNDLDFSTPFRRGQKGFGQIEKPGNCHLQNDNLNYALYADDTICCTKGNVSTQFLIRSIEKIGEQYGLCLHRKNAFKISYNSEGDVLFRMEQKSKKWRRLNIWGAI